MTASTFIPLSVPALNGREAVYINECLETNWVSTAGSFVDKFAARCAEIAGTRFAVPVMNGTAALHLSTIIAGVAPGEEVIIPALTFIGTAAAVRHAGAHCAVLDVDPVTWQLDPVAVEQFLRDGCTRHGDHLVNRATGRRVAAIMPVHLLGHPVDMDQILALAHEFELVVIEDAAEAVGATYNGRPVGGLGRIGCFSFNGNKTFTCGGGGAILTNDEALAKRALYLSTQAKDDPVLFVHKAVGYNYRMTNLQAAMGLAQLESLHDYTARKCAISERYRRELEEIPGVSFRGVAPGAGDVNWLTTIRIERAKCGIGNLEAVRALREPSGGAPKIEARLLWQPMHRSEALDGSFQPDAPVADAIYAEALSLPSSVGLSDSDQGQVIKALQRLLAPR